MCVCAHYLQREAVDETAASKSDQQQVGENEGSHCVGHFLDLTVSLGSSGRADWTQTHSSFTTICWSAMSTSVTSSILVVLLVTDSLHVPVLRVALLHPPVHDVSDQRTCHEAQQLQCAKHGRVETH